jgi:predicted nucleotidyltransferase
MKEREIAEKNKILEIITGSFLYGTNTETSDKDYYGIFMPSIEYVLGFRRCEEVDFSIMEKDESGKNTKNALDRKFYEFRKFIKLAMECNPNIIEILFVNKENTIFINEIGKELVDMRHMFPYKGLKAKFLGYAFSQKHKMVIKKDHYFDLINARDYINKFDDDMYLMQLAVTSHPNFIKSTYDDKQNIKFVVIGDLNITPSKTIKSTKLILDNRINAVGNREELLLKYGFDTKFASHLIRLMLEGIELLQTGGLVFPLKERQMILDIKNGKWEIAKILNFSNELEKEIESLAINSKLPDKPNIDKLEEFTINKLKGIIC